METANDEKAKRFAIAKLLDARNIPDVGPLVNRICGIIDKVPYMLCFAVLFLIAYGYLASQKLIWDDEFFSYYIAKGGFSEIYDALMTGADQHPPFFYWVTYLSLELFGEGHVSLRLPAMLGLLLLSVCLYYFVSYRTSRIFGLAAVLIVLAGSGAYYATEARGYGLVLGFAGLALLCWQNSVENRMRPLCIVGLSVALMCAVSSHYYAIGLVGPFALAEGVRSIQRRKIDVPVGIALASIVIPLFFFHNILQRASEYSEYFWAVPNWISVVVYGFSLIFSVGFPLAVFAVPAGWYLLSRSREAPVKTLKTPPLHEIVAALGLLSLPVVGIIGAVVLDKGYHPRYTLAAEIGWAILSVFYFYRITHGRQVLGTIFCGATLLVISGYWAQSVLTLKAQQREMREAMVFLDQQTPEDLPIAVAEISPMHMLSFYAPSRLRDRLYYVSKPASSIEYLGHDTIDQGLLDLQPWFIPLTAVPYEGFLANFDEFLTYGYVGEWTWLSYELGIESRYTTNLVGRDRDRLLLHSYRNTQPGLELRFNTPVSDRNLYNRICQDPGEKTDNPNKISCEEFTEYVDSRFTDADWESSYCYRWMNYTFFNPHK